MIADDGRRKEMTIMAKTKTGRRIERAKHDVKQISRTQLIQMLHEIDAAGSTFFEVWTKTVPNMRKTDNPFIGRVFKYTETNCQAGWIYENSVNLQRAREEIDAEFVVQPRKWGVHLLNTETKKTSKILIGHTNKAGTYNEYAHLRPLSVKSVEYKWDDGNPLTDVEVAELKTFLIVRSKSQTQETDKEILVTDYNINNINDKLIVQLFLRHKRF